MRVFKMTNKKVRIELQYDPEKDKDIIDFIDENGSTRAGFIKQVLKMYKNQFNIPLQVSDETKKEPLQETATQNKKTLDKQHLGNFISSDDLE